MMVISMTGEDNLCKILANESNVSRTELSSETFDLMPNLPSPNEVDRIVKDLNKIALSRGIPWGLLWR